MNFHGEGLPSGSLVSLLQKQRRVHGFDVLGIASTLLWLAFEITGKNFQLAVVTVLVSFVLTFSRVFLCLAPGSGTHLESETMYTGMMCPAKSLDGISDPSCRAGRGFVTILSKTDIPILKFHIKSQPGLICS